MIRSGQLPLEETLPYLQCLQPGLGTVLARHRCSQDGEEEKEQAPVIYLQSSSINLLFILTRETSNARQCLPSNGSWDCKELHEVITGQVNMFIVAAVSLCVISL